MRALIWLLQLPFRALAAPLVLVVSLTWAGRGLVLAAAGVGLLAVRSGANLAYFLMLLIVAGLLVAWLMAWAALRRLLMQRTIPARVEAGEPFSVRLLLRNEKRLFPTGAIHVREQVGKPTLAYGGWAYLGTLPARGERRARYRVAVRRRGVYRFLPAELTSTWPLGLLRTRAGCEIDSTLVVTPRLGELRRDLLEELAAFFLQQREARPCPWEEEFRALREYRPGDSLRRVHWRSSARRGELLVKEFEEPEARRLVLLLDTRLPWARIAAEEAARRAAGRARGASSGRRNLWQQSEARLELAVSFAATLAREGARRGWRVTLAAFAPQFLRLELSPEQRDLGELLEGLARLRPPRTPEPPRLDELLAHLPPTDLAGAAVVPIALDAGAAGAAEDLAARFRRPDNFVRLVDVAAPEFAELFQRRPLPEGLPEADVAEAPAPALSAAPAAEGGGA